MPAPRASMSAFLIAALTSRSVESRSLSCDFIASFTASLIVVAQHGDLIPDGRARRTLAPPLIAISAQIASTTPNGHAPCAKP